MKDNQGYWREVGSQDEERLKEALAQTPEGDEVWFEIHSPQGLYRLVVDAAESDEVTVLERFRTLSGNVVDMKWK